MTSSPQIRTLAACAALCLCFTGISYRLVQLQVTEHDVYRAQAAVNHDTRTTIHARRGQILDANGLALAQNEPVRTVIADASLIKNPDELAEMLAGPLGLTVAVTKEKLARQVFSEREKKMVPCRYIVLKKQFPEVEALELEELLRAAKIRGIHFEQDFTRVYPNGGMLCHVLGFTNSEGVGMDGIERSLDDQLRGRDGFRYSEKDRMGREIVAYRGLEMQPHNGSTVRLTIDMTLQAIVEAELDAAVREYKPKMATALLLRPQTGEILALANRPHFDLNKQDGVPEENRRNRAITDMFEPGSTFKIVATGAALTLKYVTPETPIFCENGYFTYGGRVLHDHNGYGSLSVADVLVKSSNIGVAKLAIQLGDQRMYEYTRKFGFGERTGVRLPGEITGVVHPPHRWSKVSITRLPMGHEIGATAMQVANAMSVVANGGQLMLPQIVHDYTDEQGQRSNFQPIAIRQVIPEKTANQLRDALMDVVSKRGTAGPAHVPGFRVAGKTGTAQKLGPNGYEHGKNVVSFVGFMPAEAPAFVGLVVIDEPVTKPNQAYGGLVSGPVFSRIAAQAARHLNLTPDPALMELYNPAAEAQKLAAASNTKPAAEGRAKR